MASEDEAIVEVWDVQVEPWQSSNLPLHFSLEERLDVVEKCWDIRRSFQLGEIQSQRARRVVTADRGEPLFSVGKADFGKQRLDVHFLVEELPEAIRRPGVA